MHEVLPLWSVAISKLLTFLKLYQRCPAENLTCFFFRENNSHQARNLSTSLLPVTKLSASSSFRPWQRRCLLESPPTPCPRSSAPLKPLLIPSYTLPTHLHSMQLSNVSVLKRTSFHMLLIPCFSLTTRAFYLQYIFVVKSSKIYMKENVTSMKENLHVIPLSRNSSC